MRSEELKLVQTINSSLSDRRERSLLTPHSDHIPPPFSLLPPTYYFRLRLHVFRIFGD